MKKRQFFSKMLCLPPAAIEYHISQRLAKSFPDKGLIEGDGQFEVEGFAQAQHCTLTQKTFLHNQVMTYWSGPQQAMMHWAQTVGSGPGGFDFAISSDMAPHPATATPPSEPETMERIKNAWLEVEWQGHTLDVLLMQWFASGNHTMHHWIIAESKEIAQSFLTAVNKWSVELVGQVLVFDGQQWYKDAHLFHDIKGATFENLIMQGSLKQDIRDDVSQFFGARPLYEEYGIPWKRGILFVGPPGNGKTHAVKALINSLEQPCLYVKSFKSPHGADQFNIQQVFDRARQTAPCVLVLEDLDSQLTPQNRSFFLNELDGFAANIGIITLATTNHPERLDPAILDRPSRFDRKYPFDLPEQPERHAYITMWNETLRPTLRISEEAAVQVSELAEGFSFAYLKELFLSSMMRWIAKPEQGHMDSVMVEQVNVLRDQMVSTSPLNEMEASDSQQMSPMFPPIMGRAMTMMMRGRGRIA